jgi:ribonucleoside-diphosphate reductase alpha chain
LETTETIEEKKQETAQSQPKKPMVSPGQLRIIKRNGSVVDFDGSKIEIAITKAFLAVHTSAAAASSSVHSRVSSLSSQVEDIFRRRMPSGGTIHIEEIQDQVELALMRSEEHKVAREYVLYRAERANQRAIETHIHDRPEKEELKTSERIEIIAREACSGLEGTDSEKIILEANKNLYEGAPEHEVKEALVLSARSLVEVEPNYTFATARILLDSLRSEALSFLEITENATHEEMKSFYPEALKVFINKGIELELLNSELANYDLDMLGKAMNPDNDLLFSYLGIQTLYDRYFIHSNDIRFELPQVFFMRVAMGLALNEENREQRALEFYELLSSFDYMSSTPTLFNAGTMHSQLSSCYLTTVPDDLHGIYGALQDNAMLSKWAGGLGNDWTPVRGMGAHIKGTNGKSQGVVPFLKVVNDTAVAVNQGGKRKGAVCAYLETWHLDIEEFVELRKNTGDDRRRTHDMNTANWVPDLFMERVFERKKWTLFTPNETPELHDLSGEAFREKYEEYEKLAQEGKLKAYKEVEAEELWRKILSMLFETGHPWITFKDACNLRSPQQHTGVIHSSNLCTEITLNTSNDEIAVCNLGSINIPNHLDGEGNLDKEKLEKNVTTAIRMLDNVIDINYYAVPQAENSNFKHRPIGMGIMGFQDALYVKKIPYASEAAVDFADESMELVSYMAINASSDLAKERGSYSSYEGSLWSKGILPLDSIDILEKQRGKDYIEVDKTTRLDWDALREKVKSQGMRNSNTMAIAPTATIANITGLTQSIEPTYSNLFVKSNLSGEFTVINMHLVDALKEIDMWDEVMVYDLKNLNGSLESIARVPEDIKKLFATSFEVEPKWLIEAASRRQKWIDQSQSLNLYVSEPNGKKLDIMYRMAWLRGLKTTYYLRSRSATTTEKSTITNMELNAVKTEPKNYDQPEACSIDDPDCEACQ